MVDGISEGLSLTKHNEEWEEFNETDDGASSTKLDLHTNMVS